MNKEGPEGGVCLLCFRKGEETGMVDGDAQENGVRVAWQGAV